MMIAAVSWRARLLAGLAGSLILVGLLAGPRLLAGSPLAAAAPKLVLAFFYPWYSTDAWDQNRTSDRPPTPYFSDEPAVMDRQIAEAQGAGIDGFISEWQGTGTQTANDFPTLLDRAAAHNFQATFYFITDAVQQHGDVQAQLADLMTTYSSKPSFLHWNGKPVIFFWRAEALPGGLAAWRAIRQAVDPDHQQIWSAEGIDGTYLDVFDTLHLFSGGKWSAAGPAGQGNKQIRDITDAYVKAHPGAQRWWFAGVIPGWDERKLTERPEKKYFDRRNGGLYEESWQGALATTPDLITVTSWNEWYEGTQIEPSVTYGNRYLDLTKKWAAQYKGTGAPPPQATPSGGCGQAPPLAVPGTGSRTFPETGKTVTGVFLDYWMKHGQLAQQGFPISNVMGEVSLDGKLYTVQYFERAVFEYHPENKGTAYEVLLAQLGTYRYKDQYPNGPQGSWVNKDNGRLFSETGRWVAGAFRNYWEQHGQLAQQGFPISDEFQESSLDGKTYTVQYFERAVFEYHPENAGTPYDVLLAQLGTYRYKAKYTCP